MKAIVCLIRQVPNIQLEETEIECDYLDIKDGVYFFYNFDKTNPQMPINEMVAVYPIEHFYIIAGGYLKKTNAKTNLQKHKS